MPAPRGPAILRLWVAVAAICTVATVAGYLIADGASGDFKAAIDGFAAGAPPGDADRLDDPGERAAPSAVRLALAGLRSSPSDVGLRTAARDGPLRRRR